MGVAGRDPLLGGDDVVQQRVGECLLTLSRVARQAGAEAEAEGEVRGLTRSQIGDMVLGGQVGNSRIRVTALVSPGSQCPADSCCSGC